MKAIRAVLYFAGTLVIYLGLSVAGWGLDDVPGFLASPQRTAYALIAILFALAVGIQAYYAPEGIDGGRGEAGKRVRRQTLIGAGMTALMFVALVFMPYADRRAITTLGNSPFVSWVGVVLSAAGYGLIFWSGLALGKQYSAEITIQKDHQLVTTGPYRMIRHPRYLGIICLAAGASLVFQSWPGLIVTAAILAVLFLRIHDEEALMRTEFGAAWDAYCERSWRILPYLY